LTTSSNTIPYKQLTKQATISKT